MIYNVCAFLLFFLYLQQWGHIYEHYKRIFSTCFDIGKPAIPF